MKGDFFFYPTGAFYIWMIFISHENMRTDIKREIKLCVMEKWMLFEKKKKTKKKKSLLVCPANGDFSTPSSIYSLYIYMYIHLHIYKYYTVKLQGVQSSSPHSVRPLWTLFFSPLQSIDDDFYRYRHRSTGRFLSYIHLYMYMYLYIYAETFLED